MTSRNHTQSTTDGQGNPALDALADALDRYNAAPRSKPAHDAAYEELRGAAIACGMPVWPWRVVMWARERLGNSAGHGASGRQSND